MHIVQKPLYRNIIGLLGAVAAGLLTVAAPAAADPPPLRIELGVTNGVCSRTQIFTAARVPLELVVVTAFNPTTQTHLLIPSKNVDLQLPNTWLWTPNSIDLGTNDPGVISFRVTSQPWSGSSQAGCQGIINFG
ncbi:MULTISPECIES: hypothetical protein [unclassified Nocardia]|uniref:hypothetical protein n=1 Tax=unclassified Nocardia TaxID=2637762 RepID=UPI001CE450F2|nr:MULTISPECIES: hypothetical protein [unclassified Nocardia]